LSLETEILVPALGDFEDVEVIEVLIAVGDRVEVEDPLITLESDKATMEIPSPVAGEVVAIRVRLGDRVCEGSLFAVVRQEAAAVASETPALPRAVERTAADREEPSPAVVVPGPEAPPERHPVAPAGGGEGVHASPLVRGVARELGVDLRATRGSGPAGRVRVEDVKEYVRGALAQPAAGSGIPALPEVDFASFGPVEEVPLSRIRRVAAKNLHRSWLNVPHVTQHDEADITELEAFRSAKADEAKAHGVRLSPLLFVMKAVVIGLRRYPDFRSSLTSDGQSLLRKDYFHLGIAVDTEEGLVVPVVRDVDQKSIFELAAEISELAGRARARKLGMADIQGAVFTISSLGGIGGTAFTPIVNAPEVGILGISRMAVRPVYREDPEGGRFVPRKLLPLSLSYDHRVIDGAKAARFTSDLRASLGSPRNLLV